MQSQEIDIIQHPSVPAEDVWFIRENEAPEVPQDLRGRLSVPFILTGNAEQARNLLTFVRAIAG